MDLKPIEIPAEVVGQVSMALRVVHGKGAFAMDETESDALAGALCKVSSFYLTGFGSEKGRAWTALLGVSFMVYTPKIMALRQKADGPVSAAPAALDPLSAELA